MGAGSPTISVVTVVYNGALYLRKAMESVLQQDYPYVEYIVVDGVSTDGSVEIIQSYAPRIAYWVSEPDQGISDALSKGLRRASGDVLCWLNSDDLFFRGCFSEVARAYVCHDGPVVVTGNIVKIDRYDQVVNCVRIQGQTKYFGRHGVLNLQAPAIFFKRSLYEEAGGLDLGLRLVMDNDLWFRFIKMDATFVHIHKYLGAFRLHEGSATTSWRRQHRSAFENPESQYIRQKHWTGLSKKRARIARLENKIWRVLCLDYLRSWLDCRAIRAKGGLEVIGSRCL